MARDVAVEGVLAPREPNLLRVLLGVAAHLELEAGKLAVVEDERGEPAGVVELEARDAGLGGDLVGFEVEVPRLDLDGLLRRPRRFLEGAAATSPSPTAAGGEEESPGRDGE